MAFLPVTRADMDLRGWEQLDFLYISGDAYVDHPSFGHAILTRLLESEGFRVGIIAQPDWHSNKDFMMLGRPKYAVLISSGVIDSMVNHYTASKKHRSDDHYSPGGKSGHRPDRAVIVYANKIREAFKNIPVIIGGIEASLRRFAHYDYWDDTVRRSILQDSKADLLIYGMGEKPILEIAERFKQGQTVSEMKDIRGTAYMTGGPLSDIKGPNVVTLPSFEETLASKRKYAEAFMIQYNEQDAVTGDTLVQMHGDRYVVQNPPTFPLTVKEMDRVYALPYERTYHPMYEEDGGISAIREVEFSVTSHRGCYGGCSFCALNYHQGRAVQKRSQTSIINEAKKLTWLPNFKGYIHDVGGPTANFRNKACKKQEDKGVCKERQCLYPEPCKNLIVDHSEYLDLLRKIRELPEVKKVFVRSGVRYDYLMLDKNDKFFNELCEHHVSGQLKVAPEHTVDRVLQKMGKPSRQVYDRFVKKFYEINKKLGKEQYLVPYLISGHPGSDLNAAIELAEYLNGLGHTPEQVQDFYPTPGTLSTCMYYTELDPRDMSKVYVPKSHAEKAMQRALLQFRKRENYKLVYDALKKAGRDDLIGFGKKCLIKPKAAAQIQQKRQLEKNNLRAMEGRSYENKSVIDKGNGNKTNNVGKVNKNGKINKIDKASKNNNTGKNKIGKNKVNEGKGYADKAINNKTSSNKTNSERAVKNSANSYKTSSNKAIENNAGSNKAGSNKAVKNKKTGDVSKSNIRDRKQKR